MLKGLRTFPRMHSLHMLTAQPNAARSAVVLSASKVQLLVLYDGDVREHKISIFIIAQTMSGPPREYKIAAAAGTARVAGAAARAVTAQNFSAVLPTDMCSVRSRLDEPGSCMRQTEARTI